MTPEQFITNLISSHRDEMSEKVSAVRDEARTELQSHVAAVRADADGHVSRERARLAGLWRQRTSEEKKMRKALSDATEALTAERQRTAEALQEVENIRNRATEERKQEALRHTQEHERTSKIIRSQRQQVSELRERLNKVQSDSRELIPQQSKSMVDAGASSGVSKETPSTRDQAVQASAEPAPDSRIESMFEMLSRIASGIPRLEGR